MLFLEAILYAPPFQFSMNMKHGFNLHRVQNLSSKITKPQVDLTRESDRVHLVWQKRLTLEFRYKLVSKIFLFDTNSLSQAIEIMMDGETIINYSLTE